VQRPPALKGILVLANAALKRRSSTVAQAASKPFCVRDSRYTACVDTQAKASTLLREITTQSAEETIAFGRTLKDMLAPPKIVLLRGDLGAGKTTLVKGIAAAFDAAAEEDVTSPTFTLIHEYRGPQANLFHVDLYRIDTQRELDTLALDDLRSENSILLIEWGEKFPRFVRERDVEIALERAGENVRSIRISG
jgi:tRNA threonylcarbamoyladenosine biosynthesis protein TsaE